MPVAQQHTTLPAKSHVGHYRIVRLLGEGGMGQVYLARDHRLGRKVALKIVRQDVLGNEEARQRFFREARVTAHFNHPHIVTLYDVGEHQGSPYVALEYLEGQNLRERMDEERPGLRESLRIAQAIAEALREAHAHKVLHRDLKPQNIALPTDGRLRVLDFGLAKRAPAAPESSEAPQPDDMKDAVAPPTDAEPAFQTQVDSIRGTPHYMAPEQWRMESGQPATDVWALGVILYELLAGSHPFADNGITELCLCVVGLDPVPSLADAAPDVPEHVVTLVDRCLSKDASHRPPAEEVAEILSAELSGTSPLHTESVSPFRGLLPFGERHASLFFGRDAELVSCLERLRAEALLPIVGPSGSGKSSFVQAGVIPRLRERGDWRILQLRPGPRPFDTLAARLQALRGDTAKSTTLALKDGTQEVTPQAGVSPSSTPVEAATSPEPQEEGQLARELRETPSRLALLLGQLAEQHQCRVLLFVDQLEELYTLVPDSTERAAFVQAVCTAADDPQGPIRAIFTLRDDFLWRLAEVEQARFLTRVLVLRTLTRSGLLETLERPVSAHGYRWQDASLPAEMVQELRGETAALPLLQFAAQQIWERRDRTEKVLTRQACVEVGGVAGALAKHADGVLAGLSAAQERIARDIFLRLVTPEYTRKVATREAVLDGLGAEAPSVLERLTTARAILVRKGRQESELELIHESLIQRWQRLRHWLADSREERQFIEELSQAASLWNRRGRSVDEVWQGPALATALHRVKRVPRIPALAEKFLAASSSRERRRQTRRRVIWVAAFAALLLIALAATAVSVVVSDQKQEALEQRQVAQVQRRRAELERAVALQESARSALARGRLLEARALVRTALQVSDSPLIRGLWWQLSSRPLFWKKQLGAILYDVAFSPDGQYVAAAGQDKAVHVFHVQTGAARVLRGHHDQVFRVAYSPDGQRVAASSWSGLILIWNLRTGRSLRLEGHKRAVRGLDFSPDGKWLASAGNDRTVRLWRSDTGKPGSVLRGHRGSLRVVRFSPDSKLLAAATHDGQLGLWRLPGGTRRLVPAHKRRIATLQFTPDGRHIATVDVTGTIKLWDPSGELHRVIPTAATQTNTIAFAPKGDTVAVAGDDRIVRLWDVTTKRLRGTFPGHRKSVRSVAFSPDGTLMASVGADRTLRLWHAHRLQRWPRMGGHKAQVTGVAFSPDGRRLATGSYDQTARLWDVSSGQTIRVLHGHRETVAETAFSPRGTQLATASADRTLRLWNVATGQTHTVLHGHHAGVWGVAYHPRRPLLSSGSYDGTVRLWDLTTGRQRHVLRGHRSMVLGVSFSPDGKLLASASRDRTVRLWDTATGTMKRVLTEPTSSVRAARFSPDGRQLISSGSMRSVRLWDLHDKTTRILTRLPGRVYWLAFHPDGKHMGVPLSDGTARICGVNTGSCRALHGHRSEVNYLRFSPDGRLAVTTSDDRTVRLWNVATGQPAWLAPLLRKTNLELFSHRGWARLDRPGVDARHHPTSKWRAAVAQRARYAEETANGQLLCLQTHDGTLEAWSPAEDKLRYLKRQKGLTRVAALQDRCVSLAARTLRLHSTDGTPRIIARDVTALSWQRGELLVATGEAVLAFTSAGVGRGRWQGSGGATAVARIGGQVMVGFGDGALERVNTDGHSSLTSTTFEHLPASPVIRLLAGPAGTVVAGYGDGQVGVWSLKHGTRLAHARLHGPVNHLLLRGNRVYAASELGQHLVLDLTAFFTPRCALLRHIWRRVPVIWGAGRPQLRPAPPGHRCSKVTP